MYEKFTDEARAIIERANAEAVGSNHDRIATEHILCGVIQADSGAGRQILQDPGVDLNYMRREVEQLRSTEPTASKEVSLAMTRVSEIVVERAIREARHLKHDYIGSERILLGLLYPESRVAHQVLANLGLGLDNTQAKIRGRN